MNPRPTVVLGRGARPPPPRPALRARPGRHLRRLVAPVALDVGAVLAQHALEVRAIHAGLAGGGRDVVVTGAPERLDAGLLEPAQRLPLVWLVAQGELRGI